MSLNRTIFSKIVAKGFRFLSSENRIEEKKLLHLKKRFHFFPIDNEFSYWKCLQSVKENGIIKIRAKISFKSRFMLFLSVYSEPVIDFKKKHC